MTAVHETAYPRLRTRLSELELEKIFQPISDELRFCSKKTKSPRIRTGMLLLTKVFQRLDYLPQLSDVHSKIITFVVVHAKVKLGSGWSTQYESNGFQHPHIPAFRTFLGIKAFSANGRRAMIHAYVEVLESKDDLAEIINLGIASLVRMRCVLPALFVTNPQSKSRLWDDANSVLGPTSRKSMIDPASRLQWLLTVALPMSQGARAASSAVGIEANEQRSRPMNAVILAMRQSIISLDVDRFIFEGISYSRYWRFVFKGNSLGASRMSAMAKPERMSVGASLVRSQPARSPDDFAEKFVKRCMQIHRNAEGRFRQNSPLTQ